MALEDPPDNSVTITNVASNPNAGCGGCLAGGFVLLMGLAALCGIALLINYFRFGPEPKAPVPPQITAKTAEFSLRPGTYDPKSVPEKLVFTGCKLDIRVVRSESEIPSSLSPPVHIMRGVVNLDFATLTQNLDVTAIGRNDITTHVGIKFSNASQGPPPIETVVIVGSLSCLTLPDLVQEASLRGVIYDLGPSKEERWEYDLAVSTYKKDLEVYRRRLNEYHAEINKARETELIREKTKSKPHGR